MMMVRVNALRSFIAASWLVATAASFSVGTSPVVVSFVEPSAVIAARRSRRGRACSTLLRSTTEKEKDVSSTSSAKRNDNNGLLPRDRYVATNRFAVRKGQAAKFEKRWATRKSKLATLDGFRYFHLMRRVKLDDSNNNVVYDEGDSDEAAMENYVSLTVWQKKSHFSAWRSGEAFKEAHGGTSISAFVSTMVKSALLLRGAPRPAFYDALCVQSTTPSTLPETVDGWRRNVPADGITQLPVECFVGLEKFYVPLEHAAEFEQVWAQRPSDVAAQTGFTAFALLRRDGQAAKGHGAPPAMMSNNEPTYVVMVVFDSKDNLLAWRNAHAAHPDAQRTAQKAAKTYLWTKDPERFYYEGTLVINTEQGA